MITLSFPPSLPLSLSLSLSHLLTLDDDYPQDQVKVYSHEGDGENTEHLISMDLHDVKTEMAKDAENAEVCMWSLFRLQEEMEREEIMISKLLFSSFNLEWVNLIKNVI